jgi:hypothetical protein
MKLTDTSEDMPLGRTYKEIQGIGTAVIGRGGIFEIEGGGYLANCFPDFAAIKHVLRRKDRFGEFLLDRAKNGAEIRIEAPLVTSSDFQRGRRSNYNLKAVTRGDNLEITIDYYPLLDRALNRCLTLLLQGRLMERVRCDTLEGNIAKVSDACGIPFEGGKGVIGVNQLPHIMRVFLGSDGEFPTETYRGDSTGLYTIKAGYVKPRIRCGFHLEDFYHDGVYQSFVSLRANAAYQIAQCLNKMSGLIIP